MEYGGLILLLVGMWLLQFWLTYRQTRDYNRVLAEMRGHQSGHLGVGIARSRFNLGRGTVVILVVDLSGNILDLREMTGFTVFTRFKERKELIGKHVSQLSEFNLNKTEQLAVTQALAFINEERRKGALAAIVMP